MTRPSERLFVYGTLKPGQRLHSTIEPYVLDAQGGVIGGVLVDMGSFPGLLEGKGVVKGSLLMIRPEALAITDRIEGFRPEDERGSLYIRKRVRVFTKSHPIEAWTYWLAHPENAGDRPHLIVGRFGERPLYAWTPI